MGDGYTENSAGQFAGNIGEMQFERDGNSGMKATMTNESFVEGFSKSKDGGSAFGLSGHAGFATGGGSWSAEGSSRNHGWGF